jgi:nicotinamidase-related amidase
MLIKADQSCLLVIDIQEKLMAALPDRERVIANSAWLIQIANELRLPVLASEQYPKGLGPAVPAVRRCLPEGAVMEKTHFACTAEPVCWERMSAIARQQWILVGAEAHVCVLQTALGLLEAGRKVYVVADAVASRRLEDAELALARLRAEGAQVVTREMVAFEWLQQAGTDLFRDISRRFLR